MLIFVNSLMIPQSFDLSDVQSSRNTYSSHSEILFMSEGTIWLSEDWIVNLSRLMRSLTFFWQFFEALFFWTWTSCSFFFSGGDSTSILHPIFATSLSSSTLRLSVARKLWKRFELRLRHQRQPETVTVLRGAGLVPARSWLSCLGSSQWTTWGVAERD